MTKAAVKQTSAKSRSGKTSAGGVEQVGEEAGSSSSPITQLGTSGDRLTPGIGHPWEFWASGLARRRHHETVEHRKEEALAEDKAREKELVGAP